MNLSINKKINYIFCYCIFDKVTNDDFYNYKNNCSKIILNTPYKINGVNNLEFIDLEKVNFNSNLIFVFKNIKYLNYISTIIKNEFNYILNGSDVLSSSNLNYDNSPLHCNTLFVIGAKEDIDTNEYQINSFLKQKLLNNFECVYLNENIDLNSCFQNIDLDINSNYYFYIINPHFIRKISDHLKKFNLAFFSNDSFVFRPKINEFRPLYYIYDYYKNNNNLFIKIFLSGYCDLNKIICVNSKDDYEIIYDENNYLNYSTQSYLYPSNFIILKFSNLYPKFSIETNDIIFKAIIIKSALRKSNNNKYRLGVIKSRVYFVSYELKHEITKSLIKPLVYKLKFKHSLFQGYKKSLSFEYYKLMLSNRKYRIFQDRENKADDSAEVLYKYLLKNNLCTCNDFFVVSKSSSDYLRLKKCGFNVVDFGSVKHKKIYLNCSVVITSHASEKIYNPFYEDFSENRFLNIPKLVFLQHGVIMHNHRGFLDVFNTKIDLFITSSEIEANNIFNFSGYENIVCTGLARFDNYTSNHKSKNKILYCPSWNTYAKNDFCNSQYFNSILTFLTSDKLKLLLDEYKYELHFILHPEFIEYKKYFDVIDSSSIFVSDASSINYKNEFIESKLLITDYSSLLFDFLYQNKPVISYTPYPLHHVVDELQIHKKIIYDTFSVDDVINLIDQFIVSDFKIDDKRIEYTRKLFKYQDNNNCKRINDEILKLNL